MDRSNGPLNITMWTILLFLTILSAVHSGSLVSRSARLPTTALSAVLTDLDGRGVLNVRSASVVGSRSADRTAFVRSLSSDEEEEAGAAVAYGDASGNLLVSSSSSLAVRATRGSVVFLCDPVDLARQEGLFDELGPAIEEALRLRAEDNNMNSLTVVFLKRRGDFLGTTTSLEASVEAFETAVAERLSAGGSSDGLRDAFSKVEYLDESSVTGVDSLFVVGEDDGDEGKRSLNEEKTWLTSTLSSSGENAILPRKSRADLSAARRLNGLVDECVQAALERVRAAAGDEDSVVDNLCALVTAAVDQAYATFDAGAGTTSVTSRKKAAIRRRILEGTEALAETTARRLTEQTFEAFQTALSKLKVSARLPNDMETVRQEHVQTLAAAYSSVGSDWVRVPSSSAAVRRFSSRASRYCVERLQAARLSGNFRDLPRKGLGLGFHWLLPKPFGNDFRQTPKEDAVLRTTRWVYTPPRNTVTEIDPSVVMPPPSSENSSEQHSSHWRDSVVPVPGSTQMMYDIRNKREQD